MAPESGLNIVLLGRTGAGKSASGNTILGEKAFVSKLSFKSVTTEIKSAPANIFGKQISVFDTPGIKDHEEEIRILCEEKLQSSIPCLFLVVVKVGRYTEEEQLAVKKVVDILGSAGLEKSYMLFTGGDFLKGTPVEGFIFEDEKGSLPDVVTDCFAGRFHVFNNEDGGQDQVESLLTKSSHLNIPRVSDNPKDRRIVLLGLPRVGKSASGNTILGSHKFETSCGYRPASKRCEAKSAVVEGWNVTVVDTPGISNENPGGATPLSQKELYLEIMKCIMECTPGPHALVIVVRLGSAEIALLELLLLLFDKDALKYTMILFTYGNELNGQSLDENIKADNRVSKFVEKCGGRYCSFDNTRQGHKQQVRGFLNIVDEMVEANGGQHYTPGILKLVITAIAEERNFSPNSRLWERVVRWLTRLWHRISITFMQILSRLSDLGHFPSAKFATATVTG